MSLQDRIVELGLIKQSLLEARRFYLSQKDWPKVKVFTEKLKLHGEQIQKVRHLMQATKVA